MLFHVLISYPKLARGYTPPAGLISAFSASSSMGVRSHGAKSNTAGHGNSPVLTVYALVNLGQTIAIKVQYRIGLRAPVSSAFQCMHKKLLDI